MNYIQTQDKIVFPCKVDPPNLGHIIQIKRLLRNHKIVILDIYKHSNRFISTDEVPVILKEALTEEEYRRVYYKRHLKSYVENTSECLESYLHVTGNILVFENLRSAGIRVLYLKRYKFYKSEYIRRGAKPCLR